MSRETRSDTMADTPTAGAPAKDDERFREGQRITRVSVAVNIVLTAMQLAVGFLAHSQSLIADAMHTLSDIVADDYLPDYPRFAVSYHLLSMPNKHRLRVRVWAEDPDDGPETMAELWPIATWLEMEVYDLMGVRFAGNGSLRRLFLPEDWQGHPLRKDYPLGYEEVQFSFNWREIDAKKPYAQE